MIRERVNIMTVNRHSGRQGAGRGHAAHRVGFTLLWLGFLAWPGGAQANCGAAFCSLSTDWAGQGVWTEQGVRLDLRYELITQDTLRNGSRAVDYDSEEAEAQGLPHLERKTVNRNLLLTVDYAIDSRWAVAVTLPYIDREHEHIELGGHGHAELGAPRFHTEGAEPAEESWTIQEPGDARIVGRYMFGSEDDFLALPRTWGMEFGLKLPTGATDVDNGDGEVAERPLQPGTGTTDAILGGFVSQRFAGGGTSLFAKVAAQEALNEHDDYAPGTRLSLDTGLRFQATTVLGLMAQFNLLWKDRDHGGEAEPADSGGTFLFLSPGIALGLAMDFQLYGFYQYPLYQYVNGVQLTADQGIVLGLSARF